MPSINEVIERVNRARPDAIDDETKAAWLLELDGQLYRETILRHQLTSGRGAKGPVAVCPTCGGTEITYDRVMDSNLCPACGWTDLPDFPKAFPEDGDKPLLVEAPYDGLYDLYLMSKVDFYNREADNYNNSALAYNAALDEWRKQYHRRHLPIGGGDRQEPQADHRLCRAELRPGGRGRRAGRELGPLLRPLPVPQPAGRAQDRRDLHQPHGAVRTGEAVRGGRDRLSL